MIRIPRQLWTMGVLSVSVLVYGAARYSVNVHPEESKRWVVRTGGQLESREDGGSFRPFAAADKASEHPPQVTGAGARLTHS